MTTLIVTHTKEMEEEVIDYLYSKIDPSIIDHIIRFPNFRIGTKIGNEYRILVNPNEFHLLGMRADRLYFCSDVPFASCFDVIINVGMNAKDAKLVNDLSLIKVEEAILHT